MDILRPTYVKIHLDRLMENFKVLKNLGPGSGFICPMIKANAYGHGDIAIAKALSNAGCENLGVSSVEEGLHLRISDVSENILVFGFSGREAVREMLVNDLTPVVSDFDQLGYLCLEAKQEVAIHLKFDTGMHRLGFQSHEISGVVKVLEKNPNIKVVGLGTHLHSGENLAAIGESSSRQILQFESFLKQFSTSNVSIHAYNSAAIASLYHRSKNYKFGFRPGLLVYGIDPDENLSIKPLVSPVMEFKSKIVATQAVKSGEVVSYGGTWQAQRDSVIGIVPAGYADGVCRSLSNRGEFLVAENKVAIRGRVCMDYTMVDLTDIALPTDKLLGQEVVLIGSQGSAEMPVEQTAKAADRVVYEILTCISERVPRFYGVEK